MSKFTTQDLSKIAQSGHTYDDTRDTYNKICEPNFLDLFLDISIFILFL